MLFCSDTLKATLNARNHLPGTTILVPSGPVFLNNIIRIYSDN